MFDYVDFGPEDKVYLRQNLNECDYDFQKTSAKAVALKSLLGEGWSISLLDEYFIVQQGEHSKIAVLK
jgi:hypothetical protein